MFKNRIGESAEYLKPYKDHTLLAKNKNKKEKK
jgi:hypothetical protein